MLSTFNYCLDKLYKHSFRKKAMEKIKVTFLGTGTSVPTKERNHTGILVSCKNENILVDCGEGIQRQFRLADISPTKITKILLTHWHGDHVLGLAGLMQTLLTNSYAKTLEIFGPKTTKQKIENLIRLFNIKLPVKITEVENNSVRLKDLEIQAMPMSHGIPTLAYAIEIKDTLRLNKAKIKKLNLPNSPLIARLKDGKDIVIDGRKISSKKLTYIEKGKKVCIVLDTAKNKNAVRLAKSSDLLICESSFISDEKEKAEDYSHLTAKDAAEIAKEAKVKKLILTHISQRYENVQEKILKEAKKVFKNTSIAKDFDVIEI